ncbi:MAG TPA: hypothetical protein VFG42_19745 [Baekduia sp.]|uniref:hypothetical protein n=1 Tax=Baekduia sp. TaxID=2600305 RepID=UPI002D7A07EC|nr:hypothetical protein [Baekduia sp.]HET6509037.1 hypothetical protein [Baekduia sp.]
MTGKRVAARLRRVDEGFRPGAPVVHRRFLVGRDTELELLTADGAPRAAIALHGEPGVGMTSLAHVAAAAAPGRRGGRRRAWTVATASRGPMWTSPSTRSGTRR